MIEVISEERCTDCNLCVDVCPTNVFDRHEVGPPTIARQEDCQTCYLCEAWCPVEAMFVAPFTTPAEEGSWYRDEAYLTQHGYMGKYRADLGWRSGMTPTASIATPNARARMRAVMDDPIGKRTRELERDNAERDRLIAARAAAIVGSPPDDEGEAE